jgi:RimK family alpha-L-glutamate ligase
MTGWLVVNEFLHSNKFNEIHQWLLEAADKQGITMVLKTNAGLLIDITRRYRKAFSKADEANNLNVILQAEDGSRKEKSESEADFILFWDKDVRLAFYLEQLGYPVFNSSRAIGICDDKSLTHLTLMNADIPMPETIVSPMTFENIGYTNLEFLEETAGRIGFPMVVKECFGSFGQQVYLVHNLNELKKKVNQIGTKPVLFQKFISTSYGKDIRLQVVGNRVVAGMYRYSESGDFRANLTIGGKMKAYEPTEKQCKLALRCCEIIGLDFAGVDLLFGEKEEPVVCEINSNAHFKNIFDCTGVNAADAIITHIRQKLSRQIP